MSFWTPERDAVVREMYGARRASAKDVAAALDTTDEAVRHRVRILGLKRAANPWDQDADLRLIQLRASGRTFEEVAMELGRSIGSVLGRAHRLGIGPSDRSRTNTDTAALRRVARPPRLEREPLPPQPVGGPEPLNVALADAADDQCRFMAGEPSEGMCGHQVAPGHPYCRWHCGIVYVRGVRALEPA